MFCILRPKCSALWTPTRFTGDFLGKEPNFLLGFFPIAGLSLYNG